MTSTASDTLKSDLLDTVISAYGDLDRWRSLDRLTAKVSAGGVLWGLKGQPGKEGTWRDAEDGTLAGHPVAQGSVD